MRSDNRVAVVTGANRGIGQEICRQLAQRGIQVIVTARNESKGAETLAEISKLNSLPHHFVLMDVSDAKSIRRAVNNIKDKVDRLDILVNNAAILIDEEQDILTIDPALIRQTLETNLFGCLETAQACIPMMQQNQFGRIVNMSSGMGAFHEMGGGYTAYRISKTALNAMTKIMATELSATNILVNAMCPGWVRTDMGGPNASRSVEQGADTAVWLALLPDGGPSGQFFRDRQQIPW